VVISLPSTASPTRLLTRGVRVYTELPKSFTQRTCNYRKLTPLRIYAIIRRGSQSLLVVLLSAKRSLSAEFKELSMTQQHGLITDEALEELKKRIDVERTSSEPAHFTIANRDAIRHFAWGIGDDNPLWLDEEYAKGTRHGGLVAPPCILYSMDRGASLFVGGGLPGIHGMFSGTDWEWFLPIRINDEITCTGHVSDVIEKERSQFSRRMIHQGFEVTFKNQNNQIVAKAKMWVLRTERGTAKGKGKYEGIGQHHYTPEEIKAIEADYDKEEIRGANPRYWEDVAIGEELTPIVKGPLTVTDNVCWEIAWGGGPFVHAHRVALNWWRRHPGGTVLNRFGIPDSPEAVHWDDEMARDVGVPAAYDFGPQRVSWLSHLMTNWIGDNGFLKKLSAEVRRFNLIADTTWCKGRVVGKRVENNEHLVDCEIWAENQRGEVTAPGKATVVLPSQKEG